MALEFLDLAIVAAYAVILVALALFVSREKAGHVKDSQDYFLAGRALPWWAVGASLIAANISAEQIIGQSGQGYVVGLAIAAYEWQAAIVLLIVAKFFLPIFLKREIYTMPQFLDQRFGSGVKSVMAVFWIVLYTAVNLTAVLWLGALAINGLTGLAVWPAMAALAAFAVIYSLYGGPVAGFAILLSELPGHFEMILPRDHASYADLPGIWTLLGGLWVLHFSYWGFNQYIIQRALGAKSLDEARKGLAFAAFLKLLIPLIVVVPGIAALYLAQEGRLDPALLAARPDSTYGVLMTLVPGGLRGLVFAALIAAIVSSLASMMNSISTIFTMDIYRALRPNGQRGHYVLVGRITAFAAILIALLLAQPFLGGFESAFQTIQEYTGFIAPGVVAVFLLGFFWKRMNTPGAFGVLAGSVGLSFVFWLMAGNGSLELPFVIRIWIVFLACLALGVIVSLITLAPREDRPVDLSGIRFATTGGFNIAGIAIIAILALIYGVFW